MQKQSNRKAFSRSKKEEALMTKQQVKSMINSKINLSLEHKYFVGNVSNFTDSTGNVVNMTAIPQGDTDLSRDGDACTFSRLDVRGVVYGADTTNMIRLVLFQWKPQSTPTLGLIFQDLATWGPITPLTHDTRDQYHVLDDRLLATSLNGPNAVSFDFSVPKNRLLKQQCRFQGGTTTGSNLIYLGLVTDSAAATHPLVQYNTKVWFHDA